MNKKRVIVVTSVILVLIVCAIVATSIYFKVKGKSFIIDDGYTVTEYSDGTISTYKLWEWKPNRNNKVEINFNDNYIGTKRNIVLHVSGIKFIDIGVPDRDYIIDYDKSVYAVDGSYCIRLMKDLDISNIEYKLVEKNPRCLVSDNVKGYKTIIAKLDDEYSILVEVYENDIVYSTLLDSMLKVIKPRDIAVCNYILNATRLNQITYVGKYKSTLDNPVVNLRTHRYLYKTGFLWEQSWVNPVMSVKDETICRLQSLAGKDISEYYVGNNIFYARAGDYYLGLIQVNSNTTISYLGKGEEAKCNIIAVLQEIN